MIVAFESCHRSERIWVALLELGAGRRRTRFGGPIARLPRVSIGARGYRAARAVRRGALGSLGLGKSPRDIANEGPRRSVSSLGPTARETLGSSSEPASEHASLGPVGHGTPGRVPLRRPHHFQRDEPQFDSGPAPPRLGSDSPLPPWSNSLSGIKAGPSSIRGASGAGIRGHMMASGRVRSRTSKPTRAWRSPPTEGLRGLLSAQAPAVSIGSNPGIWTRGVGRYGSALE